MDGIGKGTTRDVVGTSLELLAIGDYPDAVALLEHLHTLLEEDLGLEQRDILTQCYGAYVTCQ